MVVGYKQHSNEENRLGDTCMTWKYILVGLYVLTPFIAPYAYSWLRNSYHKRRRLRDRQHVIPGSYKPTISKRLRFNWVDSRDTRLYKWSIPVQRRITLAVLLILGAVLFYVSLSNVVWAGNTALIILIVMIAALQLSPKKIIDRRDRDIETIFDLYQSKMRGKKDDVPEDVVRILKYDDDFVTPLKARISIPNLFEDVMRRPFMDAFNEKFGITRTWVPDVREGQGNGWDIENRILDIWATPPLPTIAKFHENYILGEGISPRFFPLALTNEGGVTYPDPFNEGEFVHLVGLDLGGDQAKYSEKAGLPPVSGFTSQPMTLIAGATGGGKALDVDTPIFRVTMPLTSEEVDTYVG